MTTGNKIFTQMLIFLAKSNNESGFNCDKTIKEEKINCFVINALLKKTTEMTKDSGIYTSTRTCTRYGLLNEHTCKRT